MTAARVLRGAIIGYGHVAAEGHAPVWADRKGATIVAAVDASPDRRERFRRAHPGGRAHAAVETLLAEETLDFVDVCTPPSSHAAVVMAALGAGLHVLCEKPLTTSVADALAIADAAGRNGRVVHAVHNWLAAALCRQVSALVDAGRVGTVRRVTWRTLRTKPSVAVGDNSEVNWRLDPAIAGGGILLDHGWHAAYCVARWAGSPLRRLSARLESRRFLDLAVEDTATVDLDFGEASGQIFLTWAAEERANTVSVEGDRGRIEIVGDEVVLHGPGGGERWSCPPALSEGSHHPDWFAAVADDFIAAARGEAASNLEEAVLCARVMDAAKASSAAGGAWTALDGD
ncbi:MAG TPA: Gfo/Idh/MocA family oxidoreductase [Caulobacteraceae bacterium]|jgi:predicted dehydrogenase|nr:Gfo/Idh/MocA family oxidoreductase [Caulobacteraceae bacterium]